MEENRRRRDHRLMKQRQNHIQHPTSGWLPENLYDDRHRHRRRTASRIRCVTLKHQCIDLI